MTIGLITHAGSQWRALCALCYVDPDEATAEGIVTLLQTIPSDHRILLATQRRIQAMQKQIAGLVEERDLLLAEGDRLRLALDTARQQLPLGV